ncbi:MAG: hypothetical protein PHR20_02230 [Bacteroidales bacterium]|nr:hypothetical protein [Bacteroidales bacterium]
MPGTISWYWNRAMEFQKGDAINEYGNYETIDEDKQVIKFCSVVEVAGGVMLKVNKADHAILSDDNDNELTAFVTYMNRIKFAGTNIYVYSYQPDTLDLSLTISRDALVMSTDGTLIAGDSTNVIAATISEYLNDIKYGGEFNKTKLIDAVQAVSGVDDVIITSATFTAYDASSTTTVLTQQNYTAISGHIELGTLTLTFDE